MSKYLNPVLILVFCVLSGCSWFAGEQPVSDETAHEAKSNIPFAVKDPEKFSADVIVKTNAGGKELTSNYFIAKDGKNRLERFGIGTDAEFSILVTEKNESFRLFPPKKQFEGLKNSTLSDSPDSVAKSMTSRWLNAEKPVSFTDLGKENGLKKYQAKVEDSKNTEFTIFIDEKLDYPVKQEIWSVKGDKRELVYSMELRNISLKPDRSLFLVPRNYTQKPVKR